MKYLKQEHLDTLEQIKIDAVALFNDEGLDLEEYSSDLSSEVISNFRMEYPNFDYMDEDFCEELFDKAYIE